jgi:dihydroorotate dehydrogenase
MFGVFALARPVLHALDPERAHELTLQALALGLYPRATRPDDARLGAAVWGQHFPNTLGTAAGFDKDARAVDAVLGMGFGFAEIGTVTPRPQTGNPTPRVFRLRRERALINRLGFNNAGTAPALSRLQRRTPGGIVGVNVGANKDSQDRIADYVAGLRSFYDVASYFTVNVSSPNTPGLRDLQSPAALDDLLARVLAARQELMAAGKPLRPIVIKLAPDIAESDLPSVIEVLLARNVDGIAISNTTVSRSAVQDDPLVREAGGLSGRPLFHTSTVMLARVYRLTHGQVPLIGVGGIDSGPAAIAKIEAGASLLQLYTGLVFDGPALLARIKRDMIRYADARKLKRIGDATGRRAEEWASRPLFLD